MATRDPMILIDRSQGVSMPLTSVFCNVLDNSFDACCIRDLHHNFIYANRAFLRQLGLNSKTDLRGTTLQNHRTAIDKYKLIFHKLELESLNSKQAISFNYSSFHTNKRVIYSLTIEPTYDYDGVCIGTFWRITKLKFIGFNFTYETNFVIDSNLKHLQGPLCVFTMTEWNFLWPIYMGWREKDIAVAFTVTHDHVRRVIKRSYLKIGVSNFLDFHHVVKTLNWHEEIPGEMPYMPFGCL